MLGPLDLIGLLIDRMIERHFGRMVKITSNMVKAPMASIELSSGAHAGLPGLIASVARQVAAHSVTIHILLPDW